MNTRAVFFDVDFTLIYPGPTFQGDGYQRFCAKHGLVVDPSRFDEAVASASFLLDEAQELFYDPKVFIHYTRHIIEHMGGSGPGLDACSREIYEEWAACQHFALYEDVPEVLRRLASDGLLPLLESGVVTNRRKTIHPGRTVATFVTGSERLFSHIDDNQRIELHPCDRTNDTALLRKLDKLVAVNSALEIDLTGQVCADSIGGRIYSGIGGQVDFVRGAARSKGGKAIIALPSTVKGEASRIVPTLKEGAGVVTSRGDIHYVVTEYGVASLHGKSVHERACELIAVAHPKHRQELKRFAQAHCL